MIELDDEIADGITKASLKWHRDNTKDMVEKHQRGEYVHPDDVVYNIELLGALNVVLAYFGEK
jgi:hypothetical protein